MNEEFEAARRSISAFLDRFQIALDEILSDRRIGIDSETLFEIKGVLPEISTLILQLKEDLLDFEGERNQEINSGLQLHGLIGSQLNLKLSGFERAFKNFRGVRWWHRIAVLLPGVLSRANWAERLLRWANIVLGSLSQVLPAAGALDEFKQVVEAGIAERKSWS